MIKYLSIIIVATALLCTGCEKDEDAPQTTATTGATMQQSNPHMPPEVGQYEVLGYAKGIKNFIVKYDENLYRGGEILARAGMEKLKSYGVQTIISITPTDVERRLAKDLDLRLVELPFENGRISNETLSTFLDAVENNDDPFYIHCHGGTHRAGALCAAYRIHQQGWSYEAALIEFGRLGGSLIEDHEMIDSIKTRPAAQTTKESGENA